MFHIWYVLIGIIPRVTKDQVYRKDLWLIEKIGAIPGFKNKNIEGCNPWELDASIKYATALHKAIVRLMKPGLL